MEGRRCAVSLGLRVLAAILGLCIILTPHQVLAKTKLTVWTKFSGERLVPDLILKEEFERLHPHIEIEYVTVPSDYYNKLSVAIAADVAPDVAQVLATLSIAEFAHAGLIQPLDRFIGASDIDPSDFFPGAYQSWQYNGQTWAMTYDMDINILYWHKGFFAEAGLDERVGPRTIEELDQMAQRLTISESDGSIRRMGFVPWLGDSLTWAAPWNVEWFDAATNTVTTDNANAISMFEWMATYSERYGFPRINALTSQIQNYSHGGPFINEQLAMLVTAPWLIEDMKQMAPDQWGFSALPAPPSGLQNASTGNALTLVIPTGAKHPEEAFEYIRWRTSLEQALMRQELGLSRGVVPVRIEAARSLIEQSPEYMPIFDIMVGPYLKPYLPIMPVSAQYSRELVAARTRIVNLSQTPHAALSQVRQNVQAYLDDLLSR